MNSNQNAIYSLLPEFKLELIKSLNPVVTAKVLPDDVILVLIPWIGDLARTLDDHAKDTAAIILFNVGDSHQKKKLLKKSAHEEALKISRTMNDANTTFKLHEAQFRNEFGSGEFEKSLEILDEVIVDLSNQNVAKEIALNFIGLLNELLPELGRRKKKKWLDRFTERYQLINSKFLEE